MTRVLTRAEWHARKPKETPTTVPIGQRTATTVHHDGDSPIVVTTLMDVVGLIQRDQNFHMDGRGWNDIGYNFLVVSAPEHPEIDGLIVEGRGRDVVGAHCQDHNTPWVGVQVAVGGGQIPSQAALRSVREIHDGNVRSAKHAMTLNRHKDGFPTTCPDAFLSDWVAKGGPVPGAVNPLPAKAAKPAQPSYRPYAKGVALGSRTLRLWDAGDDVKALQRAVGANADGYFGVLTGEAVKAYQRARKIAADGIAGPQVYAWVLNKGRGHVTPAGVAVPALPRAMGPGSSGPSVRALQSRLATRGWPVIVDGDFGGKTEAVVRAFQQEKGLRVDGVVGVDTWEALWRSPVT